MDIQQQDLSYFRLRLQELLNNSFPEKENNQKFIEQRSSWASNAYEGAFLSGNPIEYCNDIANNILFEGLYFSRFDTVFQVVCNEFDTIMADEELRPFALKMFPVCEPVFDGYELTDDFANRIEFEQLYTELTGTIAIWIEEHGLQ
ncbi:DUF1896 domain-containing protein [Chryseobacterium shandongense]|uniref:DUF1896 domain-containing protein n=1 Tax=Chryseobacterium shandongense TaxID=1493872 RepID=A0ABM7BA34_9FLAO|nr:DUF1896 domain-containing protein [Chryseobacterium shandongense]AZA95667.1 DUF1896 domain-containing protein [Chryseobacterium shandongense]